MVKTPVDGELRVSVVTSTPPVTPVSPDTETLMPVVASLAETVPLTTVTVVDVTAVTLGAYGLCPKDCVDVNNTGASVEARQTLSARPRPLLDLDLNKLHHRT